MKKYLSVSDIINHYSGLFGPMAAWSETVSKSCLNDINNFKKV